MTVLRALETDPKQLATSDDSGEGAAVSAKHKKLSARSQNPAGTVLGFALTWSLLITGLTVLELALGFSHPIYFVPPEGIEVEAQSERGFGRRCWLRPVVQLTIDRQRHLLTKAARKYLVEFIGFFKPECPWLAE